MSTKTQIISLGKGIGMLFTCYTILYGLGVFNGFEAKIGNSNVAKMVFMSLIVVCVVAIVFNTVVILNKPQDLVSNLRSGLANYTGSSEKEVARFFGDITSTIKNNVPGADLFAGIASALVHNVSTDVQVNQVATGKAKKGRKPERDIFTVEVDEVQYPTPAELLAKLRATFAALPVEPAHVARVNQVTASPVTVDQEEEIEILVPALTSLDDSTPVPEFVKQQKHVMRYLLLICAIGVFVTWILSLYF